MPEVVPLPADYTVWLVELKVDIDALDNWVAAIRKRRQ